jgi:hypothetical protein
MCAINILGTVPAEVDRTINKVEFHFVLNVFAFRFSFKSVGEK